MDTSLRLLLVLGAETLDNGHTLERRKTFGCLRVGVHTAVESVCGILGGLNEEGNEMELRPCQ